MQVACVACGAEHTRKQYSKGRDCEVEESEVNFSRNVVLTTQSGFQCLSHNPHVYDNILLDSLIKEMACSLPVRVSKVTRFALEMGARDVRKAMETNGFKHVS